MKKKYYLSIFCFLLFLMITYFVISNKIEKFDTGIYQMIISLRSKPMDQFMKTITKFGNTVPVLCIIILLLIKLNQKDRFLLGMNTIVTVGMNQILKFIIKRPRPNHLRLIKQGGYSFPSGHSMISLCLYGVLIYFIITKEQNKKKKIVFVFLLTLLILLIGISRIYVGVHYPSDVLGGYLLAITLLINGITLGNHHFRGNKNDKNVSN